MGDLTATRPLAMILNSRIQPLPAPSLRSTLSAYILLFSRITRDFACAFFLYARQIGHAATSFKGNPHFALKSRRRGLQENDMYRSAALFEPGHRVSSAPKARDSSAVGAGLFIAAIVLRRVC